MAGPHHILVQGPPGGLVTERNSAYVPSFVGQFGHKDPEEENAAVERLCLSGKIVFEHRPEVRDRCACEPIQPRDERVHGRGVLARHGCRAAQEVAGNLPLSAQPLTGANLCEEYVAQAPPHPLADRHRS